MGRTEQELEYGHLGKAVTEPNVAVATDRHDGKNPSSGGTSVNLSNLAIAGQNPGVSD